MENAAIKHEHWLVRRRTRLLFRFAAVTTIVAILFLHSILFANWIVGYGATALFLESVWVKMFGFLLGVVGAPAALCLWLGMCWYWLEIDHSSRRAKTFWFFVVFLGTWVGAPVYYFFVYRKASAS